MYEVSTIEHTADIGIEVSGDSLTEVLRGCILGMSDLIVPNEQVTPKVKELLIIEYYDLETLLVDLLTDVLYLLEVKGLVICEASVDIGKDKVLVNVSGEGLDLSKHEVGMEIKAVTYHTLKITEEPPFARVLFDV